MKTVRLVKAWYGAPYELHDIPIPPIGDKDLVVRVGAAGFCHTDYQVYEGVYESLCPMTPSHDLAGTIVAVGKKAEAQWNPGQRIGMLNFRHACNECTGCRTARDPQPPDEPDVRFCENKDMSGITSNGGFAEYIVADANTSVLLPDSVPFEQAAPLICAGAPEHLRPQKLVDYDDPNAVEKVVKFAGDGGLAAVIICSDNVGAMKWSLKLLGIKGVCNIIGLPTEEIRFNAFDLVFKEMSIVSSLVANRRLVSDMMKVVEEKGVRSHVTTVSLEKAVNLPDLYMQKDLKGRLVVKM